MVSTPRISIGPAGCRIDRDYVRRGWAAKTSHPSWGARDPVSQVIEIECRQPNSLGPVEDLGLRT